MPKFTFVTSGRTTLHTSQKKTDFTILETRALQNPHFRKIVVLLGFSVLGLGFRVSVFGFEDPNKFDLTQSVYRIVLHKSIFAQIRQLILQYS